MKIAMLLVTVVLLPTVVLAAEDSRSAFQGWPGPGYYYLPGYYMLQQEYVQKELELVPEQKKRLEEIAKKVYEDMQEDQKQWAKYRDMTPEERQEFFAKMRERYQKRIEDAKAEVEKVLLPHQLALLRKIEERQRLGTYLSWPQMLERLGLSEEQKKKIADIRNQTQQKTRELQQKLTEAYQESQAKLLDVLTPEQRNRLEELTRTPGRLFEEFRPSPEPPKQP